MSASLLKSIAEQIQTQFQAIEKPTYNNTMREENVQLGFKLVQETEAYPSIFIASVSSEPSVQTDQVTYETPISAEVFGYVASGLNSLPMAFDLAEDMEKAIYVNEDLGGLIFETSLSFTVSSFDQFGIVYMVLNANAVYTKD